MVELTLIIADSFQTAHKWAIDNLYTFVVGRSWFEGPRGQRMSYVHNRESMMGFDNGTKVVIHDTWNRRPDRNELAMHMFQKGMDVWHVGK